MELARAVDVRDSWHLKPGAWPVMALARAVDVRDHGSDDGSNAAAECVAIAMRPFSDGACPSG
jgi:hypothetical protein